MAIAGRANYGGACSLEPVLHDEGIAGAANARFLQRIRTGCGKGTL